MVGAHRANLRAESVRLRQELETKRKLKLDELHRLEDELCRERMFQQMSNVSLELEGDKFLFNGDEVASLLSDVPIRSWLLCICPICGAMIQDGLWLFRLNSVSHLAYQTPDYPTLNQMFSRFLHVCVRAFAMELNCFSLFFF